MTRPRLGWFVVLLFVWCLVGCDVEITSYEIPDGYTGWVEVKYGTASCEQERPEGVANAIRIDRDGSGCSTRSKKPSTGLVHFYYVDATGRRTRELKNTGWGGGGEIWAEAGNVDGSSYRFFVGSEQKFQESRPAQLAE
jgi:hypothetical protein